MDAADLKAIRARLGLSLAQLAEHLDIPKDTLSRWELGKLPIRHDELLSRALSDLEREMRTYSVVEGPEHVYRLHEGDPDGPVVEEINVGAGNLSVDAAIAGLMVYADARGARYIRHLYNGYDWTEDLAERAG